LKKQILLIIFLLFVFLSSFTRQEKSHESIETKEALGQELFFDKVLSLDSTIACASCHKPEFAFADTVAFSKGVGDSTGIRNTPSLMNLAYGDYFFYDGRVATLEEQAIVPIESPIEMHLDFAEAVKRIQAKSVYQKYFAEVYAAPPDSANILNALKAFQETLETDGSSPHDQWVMDVDPDALSESQLRGRDLFIEDGKCFDCHFGPFFTGDEFRNIGLYDGIEWKDSGRFSISKDSTDLGKFKTPGLRNVALTAPYMHDGRFKTLEEVVDFYSNPYDFVAKPINMDPLMVKPMDFTDQEKKDLVNFLHALTDETFVFKQRN